MKLDPIVPKENQSSLNNGERAFTKSVLYPSAKRQTTISLSFLKWDYNLTPESQETDIMITHSLPKSFQGHQKVISNKRLHRIDPSENARGSDGTPITCYYDKDYSKDGNPIRPCLLATAMTAWKDQPIKKYRRSVELFIPCYVYSVTGLNDDGDMETLEINDVCLVGFSVIDLFRSQVGFGNKLIRFYSSKKGNLLESSKFEYTSSDLTVDEKLDKDDLEVIQPLRDNINTWISEHQSLYPMKYSEFEQAVLEGKYTVEEPKDAVTKSKQTASSKSDISTNVVSKKEVLKKFEIDEDDDIPPF